MFIEYVQLLTEDTGNGGGIERLINGPLPWIVGGVLVAIILWTIKK